MTKPKTGGCQCGAVRFSATDLRNAHVCHCRMCQKAAGNFFAALVGVPLSSLTWTRGEPSVFNSSEKVERGFCDQCGTPLFFRNTTAEHLCLTIGAFDEPREIPLEYQWGIEGRLPQVDQLSGLKDFGTSEEADPDSAPKIKQSNRQHPDHETDHWPL